MVNRFVLTQDVLETLKILFVFHSKVFLVLRPCVGREEIYPTHGVDQAES